MKRTISQLAFISASLSLRTRSTVNVEKPRASTFSFARLYHLGLRVYLNSYIGRRPHVSPSFNQELNNCGATSE
jgi:hypothetical protein